MLRDVAAWQAAKGYPFTFVCYASLNLAEDDEMLELMDAANIAMVFIGIESPNEESLHETKKYQNLRKSATIVDRVRKVQDSGLEVLCGMIVGFDHDDPQIFKAHYEFIRQTDIMHPTVNMLVAIPKTPLYARLKNDGRLDLSDTNPSDGMFGTNVIPLGMTRDGLRDGYNGLVRDLHDPEFYFERLENLYLRRRFNFARTRNAYWRRHPWVKRNPSRSMRWSDRLVSPADEEGSLTGVAPHLSPPDDDYASPPAGSNRLVHLRSQVRDALPPIHNVP